MKLRGYHIAFTLVTTVLLLGTSCNSYKKKYRESSVSLESTPCFGSCPVYDLTIFGNGDAVLNNKEFANPPGTFSAKADPKLINDLFKSFKKLDWDTVKDEYPTNYSDMPDKILMFKHGKTDRRIVIRGGSEHPPILDSLVNKVSMLRNSLGWKGQEK